MKKIVWLIVWLWAVGTLQAQGGGGVVVTAPDEDLNLNPLLCAVTDDLCNAVGQILFPVLTDSVAGDHVLMAKGEFSADGLTYTIALRQDVRWNDGTPITAYDVFYTYLALRSGDFAAPYRAALSRVAALLPLDEYTLLVRLHEPNCEVVTALAFPILPAQVYDSSFRERVATLSVDPSELAPWLNAQNLDFQPLLRHPANFVPSVVRAGVTVQYARYWGVALSVGADDVGLYVGTGFSSAGALERFIPTGTIDVLLNPAYERWQDVLASDAHTLIYPQNSVYYLGFNFADPIRPRSAVDPVDDTLIEQIPHPILSDLRVREALRLGTNVEELITVALQGYGERVNGSYPPLTPFYPADLALTPYDPTAAGRLLNAAGWRFAVHQRSERVCVDCTTARPQTALTLSLLYPQTPIMEAVAALLVQQYRLIGVNLLLDGVAPDSLLSTAQSQRYDLLLNVLEYGNPPQIIRYDDLFVQSNDRLGDGANTASYYNSELEQLLQAARSTPQCTQATRQTHYAQAQQTLYAEAVIVPLFAPHAMFALRGYVNNAELKPHRPFWNLADWSVFYGE